MKGWSMHIFFPLGPVFLLIGTRSVLGYFFQDIKVVPKVGSKTKMWDVGCDRMVFAINSNIFLIQMNSIFNKWSLDQIQKTLNP